MSSQLLFFRVIYIAFVSTCARRTLTRTEYCTASSSPASFLFLQLRTRLLNNPRENSPRHRCRQPCSASIMRRKNFARRGSQKEAQHPQHQLFRGAIIERAFAYLHLNPTMERFYGESMRVQSCTLRILHVSGKQSCITRSRAKKTRNHCWSLFQQVFYYYLRYFTYYLCYL